MTAPRFVSHPETWAEVYDPDADGPLSPPPPPPQLGLFAGDVVPPKPAKKRGKR